jgi:hypothetical protein
MTMERGEDDDLLNQICTSVEVFLDRIRRNEHLRAVYVREDDDDKVVLNMGVSEHESKKAILEAILAMARKLAEKNDLDFSEE